MPDLYKQKLKLLILISYSKKDFAVPAGREVTGCVSQQSSAC